MKLRNYMELDTDTVPACKPGAQETMSRTTGTA